MKIQKCKGTGLYVATMRPRAWMQYTATGHTLAGAMISLARLAIAERVS